MLQLARLAIAGAALYAGYKWISRELSAATKAAEARTKAKSGVGPRDLGALELDASSGVYRPRRGG